MATDPPNQSGERDIAVVDTGPAGLWRHGSCADPLKVLDAGPKVSEGLDWVALP